VEGRRALLYRSWGGFGLLDLRINVPNSSESLAGGAVGAGDVCGGGVGDWLGRGRLPCATYHARQSRFVCRVLLVRRTVIFFFRALTHGKQIFYNFVKFTKNIK
jgi:hypothetical protein